jgi:nuclear protein localization family protein 4
MAVLREGPLNKAAGRHAERSSAPGTLSGDLEWLCRHRRDQMCVNCAPLAAGDRVDLEMLCLHGPEGRCINCLPPDSTVDDRKFITYDEWMERRRAKCEHAFSAVCVNCLPPSAVSYRLKANCAKHRPYPAGLCSDCTPPPVESRLQEYRHVDLISLMNAEEVGALTALWDANARAGAQRAAFLYGSIVEDANYRFGQRVVVEALYEPPQQFDARTGAIVVLPDKRGKEVDAIAAACGLRKVGWMFTKKPRTGEAGEPEVSPRELMAMAQLQNAAPREGGKKPGSQFVTVVLRKGAAGIAPKGVMAADFLTALARDGVIADPAPTDSMLKMKQPRPGSDDPPAPEVITSTAGLKRKRGFELDPDVGLVTIEVAGARAGAVGRFRHSSFPVENREAYGGPAQTPGAVKAQLVRWKSEPLAWRLSDFHLLLYLATLFDADTATLTAKAVTEGKPIPEGVQLMLDDITGGAAK